jgi:hypothetical protein
MEPVDGMFSGGEGMVRNLHYEAEEDELGDSYTNKTCGKWQ